MTFRPRHPQPKRRPFSNPFGETARMKRAKRNADYMLIIAGMFISVVVYSALYSWGCF